MTYIHAPVRVILQDRNEVRVEIDNSERVVPIPSGAQGLPGDPGFSPVVSVEPITGGNRVTITDADGDTTFDVMNGAQGEQGEPGEGVPTGGVTGQVLKKRTNTDYDTYWANESGGVTSVNGQTGAVILDADDVGALPDDTFIPTKTSDLTNDSGFTDVHVGASAPTDPDTKIWLDTDEPGQSAVTSFNGMSGAVTADHSTVGAISMKRLWTNPNPTASFAAQTLTITWENYDFLVIQAYYNYDQYGNAYMRTTFIDTNRISESWQYPHNYEIIVEQGNGGGGKATRKLTFGAGTITIAQGSVNGASSAANTAAVPCDIYGIKGVLPL